MSNERDYAIAVGIQHYRQSLGPLEGPHDDTKNFVKWLIDPQGGNLPCENGQWELTNTSPSNNILLLLSTPEYTPSKESVDLWLIDVLTRIKSGVRGRRLYFYFSGHGVGSSAFNSAMLLPNWSYLNRQYGLSSQRYKEELTNQGAFEEIYVFMDCCRNRISNVQGGEPSWAGGMPSPLRCSNVIFYASEFDNAAYEANIATPDGELDNMRPRGLFTEVLINGLRGGAADSKGELTIASLHQYLSRTLPKLAKETGKSQKAMIEGNYESWNKLIGPFPPLIDITIYFVTPGSDIVLEDAEINVKKCGNSSEGQWQLQLTRGMEYVIRKKSDKDGLHFFNDGIQTVIVYEQ